MSDRRHGEARPVAGLVCEGDGGGTVYSTHATLWGVSRAAGLPGACAGVAEGAFGTAVQLGSGTGQRDGSDCAQDGGIGAQVHSTSAWWMPLHVLMQTSTILARGAVQDGCQVRSRVCGLRRTSSIHWAVVLYQSAARASPLSLQTRWREQLGICTFGVAGYHGSFDLVWIW